MTKERFAKSREQARRNKNLTQKQVFSSTLNRMNTFELVEGVRDVNALGSSRNTNEQVFGELPI